MGEKRYIISDASKMVDVESHVLRYWEEELDIEIPRNEMGHRYYTEAHINLLKKIKELKEGGFQLKAIKLLIPELMSMDGEKADNIELLKEELFTKIDSTGNENDCHDVELTKPQDSNLVAAGFEGHKSSKIEQFQTIINEVVSNALKENTEALGKGVSDIVSDNVIKEMDYLMRVREKQEEERYKKLDETIRSYQTSCKENAVKRNGFLAKLKRL